jgi:hypothetical protein
MSSPREIQVQSFADLVEQVNVLQAKVEQLSARLDELEGGRETTARPTRNPATQAVVRQEDVIAKVGQGGLLPRIAAVCFLLVVALILRTITDNQVVSVQVGSLLGLTYAVALIGFGWWLYARKSRLAPVFPGCGLLLLFSIVLETHARFEFLPTFWAYTTLLVAGLVAVGLSLRYRATGLICLGTLGTAGVGMAIDFPYPLYPYLGLLLLAATIASFIAHRRQMCMFLRYAALAFTAVFWLLWTFKLNVPPVCDAPTADLLNLSWFLPTLFLFWGTYFLMVVRNTMDQDLALGFYEGIMPTISGIGVFVAGWVVIGVWYKNAAWFGIATLVLGVVHFIVGWWFAKRDREGAQGSNAFIFAGVCLLTLSLAVAVDNIVWILPLWSGLAFVLALLASRWHSGGIRVTSYLLQIVTCGYGVLSGSFPVPSALPLVSGLAAATVSVICLLQYHWSRRHAPDAVHSAYFSWLDKKDYSAVILLVAGLISGYYCAQQGLFMLLSRTLADFAAALQSGQSVFINLGAVLLMLIGLRGRNIEIATVAGLVVLIGAVKVFILDLFGINGVSLVVSVFSFGIVAAVASVVMGKWQRKGVESETAGVVGNVGQER